MMKKLILIFLVVAISGVVFSQNDEIITYSQNGNIITINFTLPSYQILDTNTYASYGNNQLYKYINVDNSGIIDDVGFPELPQYSMDFAIPESATNISISSSNFVTTAITLDKKIFPSQDDFEINQTFIINNDYYSTNGDLYSFHQQLSEPFSIFNQKGITLSIFPFIYNPSQDRLTILKTGTFTISYSTSSNSKTTNEYTSYPREEYLDNVFFNYTHFKTGCIHIGRYLIITPEYLENTLTYFANYKRNLGYDVTTVNTSVTGDSSSEIKTYLKNLYNNSSTRPDFVLLVGDIMDIPASGGSEGSYSDPLTDLNYARLSGDDYFADIFLGRWPVSSTTELRRIINKTIFMESNLHNFQKQAVFLSGGGSGANRFDNPQRWVIRNTFKPAGWACTTLFAIDGATRNDGINAINDDYLFIIYRGHGGKTRIGEPFLLTGSDINNSNNTIYPMFFSFACLTNDFGYSSNCFGESWIRSNRGGVSFFGATSETMRNANNAIEKKVFGDAFTDEEQLAVMINLGMKRYWGRFWSWLNRTRTKRHMKSYNLLGDPSFNKSGNSCIQNLSFNYNEIFNGGDSLTYHVNNNMENNSSFTLNNNSRVTLIAGNSITLKSGFHAKEGSDFRAFISACNNRYALPEFPEFLINSNKTGLFLDTINVSLNNFDLLVYPNPFKDIITLKFKIETKQNISISILNQLGMTILNPVNSIVYDKGIYHEHFYTNTLPNGLYYLKTIINEHVFVKKIIKK